MPDGSNISDERKLIADLDEQLIVNGYEPVALVGKRPLHLNWQARPNTIDAITHDRATMPEATNTGARAGRFVPVDIDLVPADHAAKLRALTFEALGETLLERIGSKGMALCYRNETPIRKITIGGFHKTLTHDINGKALPLPGKVEILGEGNQLAIYGIHPDTKQPYTWTGGAEPELTSLSGSPAVTPELLRAFAERTRAALEELGYEKVTVSAAGERKPSSVSSATGARVSWQGLRKRLSYIHPRFDGARPECYPGPSPKHKARPLDYSAAAWVGMGLCIRDADIPLLDDEEHDWLQLVEHWSNGTLWQERTGTEVDVTDRYPVEGVFVRLQGTPRSSGAKTTIATIIDYARDGGCLLPPDDEPHSATETFRESVAVLEAASVSEKPAEPEKSLIKTRRFNFLTRDQYADFVLPPPLFPGLIPAVGAFHIIGKQSSLKSFIGTEFGFSVCTGLPAFGRWKPERQGWFVLCAGEGQDGFKAKRVRAWEIEHGIDLSQYPFLFLETVPVAAADGGEEADFADDLLATIAASGFPNLPVCYILHDTQAHMSGIANANAEHEIKPVGLMVTRQSQMFQSAVGLIAHPAKHDKESASARGSAVNTEMFSVAMKVERLGEKQDLLTKLTVIKERDEADGVEYVIQGKLVPVPVPNAPPTHSLVVDLASEAAAKKVKTAPANKYRVNLTLEALRWMAIFNKKECSTRELCLAESRSEQWLADPNSGRSAPEIVLAAPLTDEELKGLKAGQRRLRRLADHRKETFGTTRIARKLATEKEWTWFPYEAPSGEEEGEDDDL